MVSTGTSAPVLPSNSPFFGSYLFTSYSRHFQHFTVPKTSTTWTTRQWQFEIEPNSRHAIHVCSQFSILHPFDLTMGRTLLQAKIQSMRVLKFFHRCSWRFIYCWVRRCGNGWSDQSFRSNVACLSSGAHKPLNNFLTSRSDYTRQQDFGTWKVYCVCNVTFHAEFKYATRIFPSPTVFVQ